MKFHERFVRVIDYREYCKALYASLDWQFETKFFLHPFGWQEVNWSFVDK